MIFGRFKHFLALFAIVCTLACCQKSPENSAENCDLQAIKEAGELRVAVLQNAENNALAEFNYELVCNFANTFGLEVKLLTAASESEAKELIISGKTDIAACEIPCTKANKKELAFCNVTSDLFPVLVQKRAKNPIKTADELVGKTVNIFQKSPYLQRLNHLNEELGGGICINELSDTFSAESLATKIRLGEVDLLVLDNIEARFLKQKFSQLDISLQIGLATKRAWAVNQNSPQLLEAINNWHVKTHNSLYYSKLYAKYFENRDIKNQRKVSPYDDFFKKYAPEIGWDWRLLAALAYHESRFNVNTVSHMGAAGLMQIMPVTAEKLGLDSLSVYHAEPSVLAATKYIRRLSHFFAEIDDPEEQKKFILASYNAGPAHVLDAQALAKKYGENPNRWEVVEKFLLLKSEPEFYNDSVCHHGYFRANHTVQYVQKVFDTYYNYCEEN